MDAEQAKKLREPFPKSAIGKLPKGGAMLDYVGHAATTDRLLAVDPGWSWEPMATDENGLPLLDGRGNLWIKLTICGMTRIGVGDGKSAKEVIGDAIRNAAMRFGVALDLWAKEDLHEIAQAKVEQPAPRQEPAPLNISLISDAQSRKMHATFTELGITDRDLRLAFVFDTIGREIATSKELTKAEAGKVLTALGKLAETQVPA